MRVINLYGGPGSGKSTVAAEVFALLKHEGVEAELQREWIKGPIWDGYKNTLDDQLYILAKHYREFQRFARGGVEVVVSDAPILLSLVYGKKEGPNFGAYVVDLYNRFDNFDVYLERGDRPYKTKGRLQDVKDAIRLDKEIWQMVVKVNWRQDSHTFSYTTGKETAAEIVKMWTLQCRKK